MRYQLWVRFPSVRVVGPRDSGLEWYDLLPNSA
jgi:hypothetical protein